MSQKAEARDIGAGMNREIPERHGWFPVQRRHDGNGFREGIVIPHLSFYRCVDNTASDLFCQDQNVAGLSPVVFPDLIRMNEAGHTETVERLVILNRMAAHQNSSRLHHLVGSAL